MKTLTTFLLVTAFLFQCCGNGTKSNNEIIEVSMSVFGGDTPIVGQIYVITEDSVHYELIAHDRTQKITQSYPNTERDWKKLLRVIDLEGFKNIKNGTSRQPFDGYDTEITVKTNKEEIAKLNAENDESWTEIQKQLFDVYYQRYVNVNKETKKVVHLSFEKSVFEILFFFVTQNNGNRYLTGMDRFEVCGA